MKIFLAGATGAVGKRLVPALRNRGYEVIGLTRSPDKAASLHAEGAYPVVADALDRDAITRAMKETRPHIIVHQLTALTGVTNYRNFDKVFAATNRLRTEGTDILLEAARAVGAERFVAQSYGGWNYEQSGDGLKTERDPLTSHPPRKQQKSLDAIEHLENVVLGERTLTGIPLRFGNLYGPGTNLALDGEMSALVRARKVPLIGSGGGIWSFLHVDDAASGTIAAIEHGTRDVYNICDDDPAPVAEWLPELARALGAKPPMHVPSWIGRLAAGEVGVSMMTQIRGGMSNAKAKRELHWEPRYPSWRQGFWTGLGQPDGEKSPNVSATAHVTAR
jgi:nucleoside-diphosphate-sugar epimerase